MGEGEGWHEKPKAATSARPAKSGHAGRAPRWYLCCRTMADAAVTGDAKVESQHNKWRILEGMKSTAGVLAAIAGALTGLWTVYDKVKSEARQYTAASYETLAPQVNQMNEALRQLQQENQELRQALVTHSENPKPLANHRAPRPVASARPQAPGAPPPPAAQPAAGNTGNTAAQPAEQPDDTLGQIVGTVHQARQAVEAIRRVPDSFDKVLKEKGK